MQAVGAANGQRNIGPCALPGDNQAGHCPGVEVAAAFVETGLAADKASQVIVSESGKAFDPEAVRLFFKTTKPDELPRQVRELMLNELRPGMHLARGIFSPAGLLLIPEGQELTSPTISKIKNHNLLTNVTQRLLVYS